jgi:hypothetical protein
MMSKYVLTHQPNLVNLYMLGRLRPPRQPLPLGEAADHHLKAYPGGYRGPTDRDPTLQRPSHGESGSPPDLAFDSHRKVVPDSLQISAPGSPQIKAPVSPQAPDPSSLPMLASVSTQ